MAGRIFGIIPAAGRSRRMGRDKQLIDVGGRPMLAIVIEALLDGGVSDLYVVTRRAIFEALSADVRARARFVENDDPATEMIDSIRLARMAFPENVDETDAVAVCPGDLPAITAGNVRACVDAFIANPDRIVVATHGMKRGHPIIIPASLMTLARFAAYSRGLNVVTRMYADRVLEVNVEGGGVTMDVDTPADLRALRQSNERTSMSEQIHVTAFFNSKPDKIDALTAVLSELAPPSRAEPGCIEYSFYQDTDDPTKIVAIETWKDMDAINLHLTLPHFVAAAGKLDGLVEAMPDIYKLRKII